MEQEKWEKEWDELRTRKFVDEHFRDAAEKDFLRAKIVEARLDVMQSVWAAENELHKYKCGKHVKVLNMLKEARSVETPSK